MELVRQKNVATIIAFPIIDADGDTVTAATALDSELDTWTDGSNPDGFTDCTNEATEIGTTGIYYLSLTSTEMNNDYIYIQVKTSSSGAKTQHILINTMVGDPLNRATTDDGGTINVAAGVVEAQVKSLDANTITASVIATGAIDADAIADNAIDAGAIAADAITAAKIADGAIDAATFAAGAINAAAIATDAITAAKIAADAIGASELAADAVTEIQSGLATASALATVQADTDDIQTRLPASLVSGRIDASVGAMASSVLTATAIATDAITASKIAADAIGASELAADAVTEIQSGLATAAALATVQADTDDIQTRLPATLVSGRIDASVGAIAANAITAASIATGAVDADAIATDAANEIADALLDRTNGIETSYTLRQALRLILSSTAAKLSGAATTTVAIRDVGDTKDRITATVDANGNRTAVTLDAT